MTSPAEIEITGVRAAIIRAAFPLFAQRGAPDLNVEEVLEAARAGADAFAAGFEASARERGNTPEERLLATFDVFDDWFHRDDYEACTFITVLIETGKDHPLGPANADYLNDIRAIVEKLATEANLRDPREFALSWHILLKGSIMNAVGGDQKSARRAKAMARALVREHRQPMRWNAGPGPDDLVGDEWIEYGDHVA